MSRRRSAEDPALIARRAQRAREREAVAAALGPWGMNFDPLADRFESNIYRSLKGRVRLEILREDLQSAWFRERLAHPCRVLDAGCGPALLSVDWALQGHAVTLVELSPRMLAQARQTYESAGVSPQAPIDWHCAPLQTWLAGAQTPLYDLVLLHAVLEWTPDPRAVLEAVCRRLAPGGLLSVTFYNLDGFLYRRLLQGNFRNLDAPRPRPHLGDLTPIYPLRLAEVRAWVEALGLQVVHHRGLRCFVDYMHPSAAAVTDEQLMEQERVFSLRDPFREVARYLHVVIERTRP